jgi:hypothetical protein
VIFYYIWVDKLIKMVKYLIIILFFLLPTLNVAQDTTSSVGKNSIEVLWDIIGEDTSFSETIYVNVDTINDTIYWRVTQMFNMEDRFFYFSGDICIKERVITFKHHIWPSGYDNLVVDKIYEYYWTGPYIDKKSMIFINKYDGPHPPILSKQ